MALSPQQSFFDESHDEGSKNMDSVVEHITSGLKSCLHNYNEKATENFGLLEKLGCNLNDLPQNLRLELKEIFNENEVFSFNDVDSKEMVTINAQHMMQNLCQDDELTEVQRLQNQIYVALARLKTMHSNFQRKLEVERAQSQYLEEKANEKTAQEALFRGKLEQVQEELMNLQHLSKTVERPKYSFMDLQGFNEELAGMKENMALTKTKLNRYKNLPFNEKEAVEHLARLQQELVNVEDEIKKKINNY